MVLSFGSRAAAEADGSNGPTVIFVNSTLADDDRDHGISAVRLMLQWAAGMRK
jgi:hypothetical protein